MTFKRKACLPVIILLSTLLINKQLQAATPLIYGMTLKTVFSFNPATDSVQQNYTYNSANSDNSLVYDSTNGLFYGIAAAGGNANRGIIFSFNPVTRSEQVLWNFGAGMDGQYPVGTLILNPLTHLFYGVTNSGGAYNYGTIFGFNPANDTETVLVNFDGLSNGKYAAGGIILNTSNNRFYGMTTQGGDHGKGTIYSYDVILKQDSLLYSFQLDNDGENPYTNLIYDNVNGLLYGLTEQGGSNGYGTLFSFNPKGNEETVLWNFGSGTDGASPVGGISNDVVNGLFYGLTFAGGDSNIANGGNGTIFSFNPSTGQENVVWSFRGSPSDGLSPDAGTLLYDPYHGIFYGVTGSGGSNGASPGNGIIFSFNPADNTEKAIWNFDNYPYNEPVGSLVLYPSADTNSISTGIISALTYCPGSTIIVPYTISGKFKSGNTFTVQLSSNTGSFDSPLNIGTVNANVAGYITATIPAGLPAGKRYRVRVVSNAPALEGSDNGSNLSIGLAPGAAVTLNGPNRFCEGGSVILTAKAGTGYQYEWNTGATTRAITVSASGSYVVTTTGADGCSKTSIAKTVVVHPLPVATITASGTICKGATEVLSVKNSGKDIYLWSTGATTNVIDVTNANTYFVTVTTPANCSAEASKAVSCPDGAKTINDKTGNSNVTAGAFITVTDGLNFLASVYPNPFSGHFQLKVQSNNSDNLNIRIFNVNGQLLEERASPVNGTDIVLGNNFTSGVYILRVQQGETSRQLRVVKVD